MKNSKIFFKMMVSGTCASQLYSYSCDVSTNTNSMYDGDEKKEMPKEKIANIVKNLSTESKIDNKERLKLYYDLVDGLLVAEEKEKVFKFLNNLLETVQKGKLQLQDV